MKLLVCWYSYITLVNLRQKIWNPGKSGQKTTGYLQKWMSYFIHLCFFGNIDYFKNLKTFPRTGFWHRPDTAIASSRDKPSVCELFIYSKWSKKFSFQTFLNWWSEHFLSLDKIPNFVMSKMHKCTQWYFRVKYILLYTS